MTPFERLTELRGQYPPVMTPEQIGALLNRLAWEYRSDGMRLLGKDGGHNVPQPRTGTPISSDYLVHRPTQTGHDVLSGREDGTTAVVAFTWGPGPEDLRDAIASEARTIVDPVNPGAAAPPADPPIDPPIDPPVVVPPPVSDANVERRLVALEALYAEQVKQQGLTNNAIARLDRRQYRASVRVPFYGTITITSDPVPE